MLIAHEFHELMNSTMLCVFLFRSPLMLFGSGVHKSEGKAALHSGLGIRSFFDPLQ